MNEFIRYRNRLFVLNIYNKAVQMFILVTAVLYFMGNKPVDGSVYGDVMFALYMVIFATYPVFMWLSRSRNCKNCGKKIDFMNFLQMETYSCPQCGNSDFPQK